MIIFLAGSGYNAENTKELHDLKKDNWGVLLSYKDVKTKNKVGCTRFQTLMKRKPHTNLK